MEFFLYILIGFAAQMIDGTMGMAYGVSCRSFLRAAADYRRLWPARSCIALKSRSA